MDTRKSPTSSATLYKVGAKKTGNDGNIWQVTTTSNNTKRWQLVRKTDYKKKSLSKMSNQSKKGKSTSKTITKTKSASKKGKSISKSKNTSKKGKRIYKSTSKNKIASIIASIKESKSGSKYLIHDNGGRPFLVKISDKKIDIYTIDFDYTCVTMNDIKDDIYIYDHSITGFEKVFIGKSPLNPMTKFSGGHGPKFDGNSILVKMSKNKYIYIGSEIYSFNTTDEIIKYTSPVGNNDVPYPFATGTKRTYLMTENVYINNDDLKNLDNANEEYYSEDNKIDKHTFAIKMIKERS